jgi:putative ABC transport system permease protein
MFGLVLNALGARRAQAAALLLLTVLAAVGASAAPWFYTWGRASVAAADVAAAPAVQRVVVASGAVRYGAGAQSPIRLLRERIAQDLVIPGAQTVVGARMYATMTPAGDPQNLRPGQSAPAGSAGLYLNYRDDICAQVRIQGTCPTNKGEVLIGRTVAQTLGITTGQSVTFEGFRLNQPLTLQVTGLYEVVNEGSPYWTGADLLAGPVGVLGTVIDEPAFASEETLLGAQPTGLDLDVHLFLPPAAFNGQGTELLDELSRATPKLRQANLEVNSQAAQLVDQLRADQRLVGLGIGVAATQLVLLCWFVLFLAVRHTSDDQRGDIGLLKLRGTASWRTWAHAAAQSALPMLTGAVIGWGLGYLAAGILAENVAGVWHPPESRPAATLGMSAAAAALACLGALAAAVLAEWGVLRLSVIGLLRRVPWRRRGWRAEVGDLVIVALAAAGVYQGYAEARTGEASTLALLAPGLVGLAVALLVARALPWLAAHAGAAALRTGRPGAALTALHLARRPGTHRVFAVLTVATSVFATVIFFWHTATVSWEQRATQQLGAARVLTVRAANSSTLLAGVRAVDPSGTYAMAVAYTNGVRADTRTLAVDTSRLTTVATMDGVDWAALAQALRPTVPSAVQVTDGDITLDATGPAVPQPARLRLYFGTDLGASSTVDFGPVTPGRANYVGHVSGCGATGCRLVAIEPIVNVDELSLGQGAFQLYRLSQGDREVVSPAAFSDITRWRAPIGASGVGNIVAARDGHLTIVPFSGSLVSGYRRDPRVFTVDAPVPLPVVLAGDRPVPQRPGDSRLTILGTERVAYEVVANVPILPRLGNSGALVDLQYAQRSVARSGEAAAFEVWLTPAAPPDIVDRLAKYGIQVAGQQTVAEVVERLADQGPGVALRFQLFAAAVVLLLAAGTVVVTAIVERRSRVEELAALRAQGLSEQSMSLAGYGGTGVLVITAVLAGLIAASLGQLIVAASMPVFADGWSLLPPQRGVQLGPLLVALLSALAVLGVTALAGSAQVVGAVEYGRRGEQA